MKQRHFLLPLCCLALAITAAPAQTPPAAPTSGSVSASFTVGAVSLGSLPYSVSASVSYPVTTDSSSYIPQSQLSSDVSALLQGYPSPNDPAEAVLASAAKAMLKKYPQFNGFGCSASWTNVDVKTGKISSSYITVTAIAPSLSPGAAAEARSALDAQHKSAVSH